MPKMHLSDALPTMTEKETATFELDLEVEQGRPYAAQISNALRVKGFHVGRIERTDVPEHAPKWEKWVEESPDWSREE